VKRIIAEYIAFALFILSLGYIIGTAGSLELDYITMGQAIAKISVGLIVFGANAVFINYLQSVPEREIKRLTKSGRTRVSALQKQPKCIIHVKTKEVK
jgi:hypothetical protein